MKPTMPLSPDLALPLDAATQKFAILAQSGAGKTYTATKLAEEMLAVGIQVVAIDPVGVWWGLRSYADGKPSNFKPVIFGGQHGDLPLTDQMGGVVARLIVERGISAVIDTSDLMTGETTRFMADFAEHFLHAKKKHVSAVHLFFEEAQLFAPQNPEPSEGKMLNRVERLLKIGRNFGVGWTLVSQQPQAVHKRCLNQAGCLFALRTLGKHEKKAIAEWVSDKARSDAELDLVGNLPSLETGEAFVWSPSWLKVATRVRISKKVTFDASATPEVGVQAKRGPTVSSLDTLVAGLKVELDKLAEPEKPSRLPDNPHLLEEVARLKKELDATKYRYRMPPAVTEIAKSLFGLVAQLNDIAQAVAPLQETINRIDSHTRHLEGLTRHSSESAPTDAPSPTPNRLTHSDSPTRPRSMPVRPNRAARQARVDGLNKGARAILVALANVPPGATRQQVAILAGLTAGSGTFSTYLSELKQLGLLETRGGEVALTDAGGAYLRDNNLVPKRPQTTVEILALWEPKFGGGAKAMLRELVSVGPHRTHSRDSLAHVVGLTPGSGTFSTYLSALHAAGLIVKHPGGGVSAAPSFFP